MSQASKNLTDDELETKIKLIKSHLQSAQTRFRTYGVAEKPGQMDEVTLVIKRLVGDASYLRDLIKGDA